jgi:uncharacterized protein (DUF1501 family)
MPWTRREILRGGAAALAWATSGGAARAAAATRRRAPAATAAAPPVVVTLNLFGGNDYLNTVVPLRQYGRYRDLRPALGLPQRRLLPLPGHEAEVALNPGLEPLRTLFAAGRVALVHGVGCPRDAQGLFDHEASQQNLVTGQTWGTAPPAPPSGWLGRWLDTLPAGELPAAIDFSSAPSSEGTTPKP